MSPRSEVTVSFPSAELPLGGVKVVRHEGLQAAVFRLDDGEVVAVDNRCPHEGYPLASGVRTGSTLTCCWHNFKFDLHSGACLKGDEAVRTYVTSEDDGTIDVRLAAPDPDVERPAAWESLHTALWRGRTAQALRDTARLLTLEVDALELLGALAADDGRRAEWGSTHVLAVAADLATLPPEERQGIDATFPLSVPIEMVTDSHRRLDPRPVPAALSVPADTLAAHLAAAVEAEDLERAEGLVRGAVRGGASLEQLEDALMEPVAAHYLDFGHAAIYLSKLRPFLRAIPSRHVEDVLAGFVVGVVNGTREDTLPGWRRWNQAVDATATRAAVWAHQTGPIDADFTDLLVEDNGPEAVARTIDALDAGAAPQAVAQALVVAGAERMLRFDPAIDLRLDVQDDWLSVSHILTFTTAVHTLVGRWRHPRAMRWLLMAARMVGHHRVLDAPEAQRRRWGATPWDADAFAARLHAGHFGAMDFVTDGARTDPDGLRRRLLQYAVDDGAVRPIVVAHQLKLAFAAREACLLADDPRPALASVRMLLSPMRERRVRRWAGEAVALVGRGEVPKLLAP